MALDTPAWLQEALDQVDRVEHALAERAAADRAAEDEVVRRAAPASQQEDVRRGRIQPCAPHATGAATGSAAARTRPSSRSLLLLQRQCSNAESRSKPAGTAEAC